MTDISDDGNVDDNDDYLESSLAEAVAEAHSYLEKSENDDDADGESLQKTIQTMATTQLCVHPEHSHSFAKVTFPLAAKLRKCAGCGQPLKTRVFGGGGGDGEIVKCVACSALAHRFCALSPESPWKEPCPVNGKRMQEANETSAVITDDEEQEDHEEEVDFEGGVKNNDTGIESNSNRQRMNSYVSNVSADSMESQELDIHEEEDLLKSEQEEIWRQSREIGLLDNNNDESQPEKQDNENPQESSSATKSSNPIARHPVLTNLLRTVKGNQGQIGKAAIENTDENLTNTSSHDQDPTDQPQQQQQQQQQIMETMTPRSKRAWLSLEALKNRKGNVEDSQEERAKDENQAEEEDGNLLDASVASNTGNSRRGSWFQRQRKEESMDASEQEAPSTTTTTPTSTTSTTECPEKPPSRFNIFARKRVSLANKSTPEKNDDVSQDEDKEEDDDGDIQEKSESAVAEEQFSMFLNVDDDDDEEDENDNFHDVPEQEQQQEAEGGANESQDLTSTKKMKESELNVANEAGSSNDPEEEGDEEDEDTSSERKIPGKEDRERKIGFSIFRRNKSSDDADQIANNDADDQEETISFEQPQSIVDAKGVLGSSAEEEGGSLFGGFSNNPAFVDTDDDDDCDPGANDMEEDYAAYTKTQEQVERDTTDEISSSHPKRSFIRNPFKKADEGNKEEGNTVEVSEVGGDESPESVPAVSEEPMTPTATRSGLRLASIFQGNSNGPEFEATEPINTEAESGSGQQELPNDLDNNNADEENDTEAGKPSILARVFSSPMKVASTVEVEDKSESIDKSEQEIEYHPHQSGSRLFRLFSENECLGGEAETAPEKDKATGKDSDAQIMELEGGEVGESAGLEKKNNLPGLFRLFSKKDDTEKEEAVAEVTDKEEGRSEGASTEKEGKDATAPRFSLFSGFRRNTKDGTHSETVKRDLAQAWVSESPPSHWKTTTTTSFSSNSDTEAANDRSDQVQNQNQDAPDEPLHYANHPFASVSHALQDNILALLGGGAESEGSNDDESDPEPDETTPLKPKSTLSMIVSPESPEISEEVDIKQTLGEIKADPVHESTLKKLASGTYETVKAVTTAQQKMGMASVAGGIAGGVAGLMFAGPAGAVMGVRYGQTAGMLGVVLEGSLTVGVVVAGVCGGRLTAEKIQEQMNEHRILTIGERGVSRKVMLVRPAIRIDPAWHQICAQAQRSSPSSQTSSFSFNLFSSTDDIKHERYEKTSDIVDTEEDEIPTGEKVLLLVSRVLSDKQSFPGHVYRCLMHAFRDRCEMRRKLVKEKEEFPHLCEEEAGKDFVSMGDDVTVSVSPRARREDAHGVIKYITATLLEVRPGLASMPSITETTASVVEALVFGEIFDLVYEEIAQETIEKDKRLIEKIDNFEYERFGRVGVPLVTEGLVSKSAIDELHRLPDMHTAVDKLRHCVVFLEMISEHFANASKAGAAMGADSLLKMVCQHIIAAKMSNINAEVAFLEEFARDEQLLRGKDGYSLVTLQAALHFLNMSVDFERDIFGQENDEENVPIATDQEGAFETTNTGPNVVTNTGELQCCPEMGANDEAFSKEEKSVKVQQEKSDKDGQAKRPDLVSV